MSPGNDAILVSISDLKLDPRLQARTRVDQGVVDDYAQLVREGAAFPPIDVVLANNIHLVTDGWHRVLAHQAAGRQSILAEVRDGTPRDALLAAIAANSTHGLPRSQDDKRRAVRLLLGDPEWAKLSSRELATLARVSHTFINLVRKRYGVRAGEVLDEDVAAHVDGELPEAWRPIMAEAHPWNQADIERIRTTRDPRDLLGQATEGSVGQARALRRAELAVTPWPWPEDDTEEARTARRAALDTVADLKVALCSAEWPVAERDQGYLVLEAAVEAPRASHWRVEILRERLAGRPRLLEALEQQAAAVRAQRDAHPWVRARAVYTLPPDEQAQAVAEAPESVLQAIRASELAPEVRDGAYRQRVRPDAAPCPDPACSGWVHDHYCVLCHTSAKNWADRVERASDLVGSLVAGGHHALQVDEVVVNRAAVDLLAYLAGWVERPDRGRSGHVAQLAALVRDWQASAAQLDALAVDDVDDEDSFDDDSNGEVLAVPAASRP